MKKIYKSFVSSDGLEILVGNRAESNDYLTFNLSLPQDFWLHVADNSGSHVIVRNQEKLDRLPKKTLQEATSIAAYYSKSRNGGQVAVHYTQRKNLRKKKGSKSGSVILKAHKTIKVKPRSDLAFDG
tara:strand:- start:419 stop:799 length:381 start_codon:yes stop_codon:yes gene_type:complete